MTRRTDDILITAEGRDKGKLFCITEMTAAAAEEWALRAILALSKNGVEIPDEVIEAPSLAGVAFVGLKAFGKVNAAEMIELFRDCMKCVEIYPGYELGNEKKFKRALIEGDSADIEEVQTRVFLRTEVISLHLGFSLRDAIQAQREAMKKRREEAKTSRGSRTSRQRSPR